MLRLRGGAKKRKKKTYTKPKKNKHKRKKTKLAFLAFYKARRFSWRQRLLSPFIPLHPCHAPPCYDDRTNAAAVC